MTSTRHVAAIVAVGAVALAITLACAGPTATPTIGSTAIEQRLARGPRAQPAATVRPQIAVAVSAAPAALETPTAAETPAPPEEPRGFQRRATTPTPIRPRDATSAIVSVVEHNSRISLLVGNTVELIDLIGVVPVERVHLSRPVDCFLADANRVVRDFLPTGARVAVEFDPITPRDKDGRLRVGVWPRDDLLLNVELMRQGLGRADATQRGTRYYTAQRDAERDARLNYRGVWSDLQCIDRTVWIGRR